MKTRINDLLADHFGIRANRIERLDGYANENYRIETDSGKYVLKLYDVEPNLTEIINAENEVLEKLSGDNPNLFPTPQRAVDGKMLFYSKEQRKLVRVLTFLKGKCIGESEYTPELLYSFGETLAGMNTSLLDFRNIAIESRKSAWDLQHYGLNKKHLPLIKNPSDRKLVEYFFLQAKEFAEPFFEQLRKSTIHGDANEWNVLESDGRVSGIIDFGDLFYSPLITEIAIALAYAALYVEDPVEDVLPLIEGYHNTLPLFEQEIGLLYYLIPLRLCISVCNSAKAARDMPENEYAFVTEKRAWHTLKKWICVNPLSVEDKFRKAAGMDSKIAENNHKDLAKRNNHTSRALSLQFSKPIKMVGAAFQNMFDSEGNSYLDCCNNIPQVGHTHPRVVEAGQKSMARLNTNTRYLNETYNVYAENLLKKLPASLSKIFFVNSGSAASDLAIRLAMTHTVNKGIMVMEHGYHGNTRLGIDISHYKYNRKGGGRRSDDIFEAEIPDTYKGKYRNNDGSAGKDFAKDTIEGIKKNGLRPAAFVAEPIIGCGGQIPLAKGYLKEIYPFIREHGGVCISDEVQTGFGRLGRFFWGFEMQDVVPDIVIMGKPMGNGHPMAAVVTTAEIAASFETGMEFFSSFGGNPVSCAIGQAVLDVLEDEMLPENAQEVGKYLLGLFENLVRKYEFVGDARGEGLMLGLELVRSKQDKKPFPELASHIQNELKENGIIVGTDGPVANVIKIKPPICFTKENADSLAGNIDKILIKWQEK